MEIQGLRHKKVSWKFGPDYSDLKLTTHQPETVLSVDEDGLLSPQLLNTLAQGADAEVALGQVVEGFRRHGNADYAGVLSHTTRHQALRVIAAEHSSPQVDRVALPHNSSSSQPQPTLQPSQNRAEEPICVIKTSIKPLQQALKHDQKQVLNLLFEADVDVQACLILPLPHPQHLGSWLVLTRRKACGWSRHLVAQINHALSILGLALRQYYLQKQRDDCQDALSQRDQQLQHSLGQHQKLQAQVQKQVAQLRYVNQLKDDFLNTTSHELRTPLTSMMLAIRMLRRHDLTPERQVSYMDILEQQCNREISLINDLLKLRQLEAQEGGIHLDWIQLPSLLDGLMAYHQPDFQAANLAINLTCPKQLPPLQTDANSLRQIFNELLVNACKYAQPQSTVDVAIEADNLTHPSAIMVMISNRGVGILADEQPYIFDKFHRGRDATQRAIQGTGLGLALVKALVTSLNGQISVRSEPEDATGTWLTQFTVVVPLQQHTLPLVEGL